MPAIALWFLGPIGRYVAIAIAAAIAIGGIGARGYYKGYTHERDKWNESIRATDKKVDDAVGAATSTRADGVRDKWDRDTN